MDLQAQKIELMQLLLSTRKESVINRIKAIFEEEMEIVGSKSDGSIYTLEMLQNDIKDSEKDIKEGRILSTSDVKKHLNI
ncbi:hypothetical protein N9V83_00790 [Flavobacteriales bacterium]|nr:hypothetical protein [Flavobacteriales bacterium]